VKSNNKYGIVMSITGIPAMITAIWAFYMGLFNDEGCWNRSFEKFHISWLIEAPVLAALFVSHRSNQESFKCDNID
jgi:hypothetical protein